MRTVLAVSIDFGVEHRIKQLVFVSFFHQRSESFCIGIEIELSRLGLSDWSA